ITDDTYKDPSKGYGFPKKDIIEKATEICVDKDKKNLIFRDKDTKDDMDNQLNNNNIYDITNVFLNTNIEANKEIENQLVIYGPKKDLNTFYSFNKRDFPETLYEPEKDNLKYYNAFSNKQNGDYIKMQIFYLIFNCPYTALSKIYKECGAEQTENPINDFMFLVSVIIPGDKKKKLEPKQAKVYNEDKFIVELNKEIILDKRDLKSDKEIVTLEAEMVNMVQLNKLSQNKDKVEMMCLDEYLNPYKIGETKALVEDVKDKYEFQLFKNGTPLEGTKIVSKLYEDKGDFYRLAGFYGKDYSIGDHTYLIEDVDKKYFDKVLKNENFPETKKENYFNVKFNKKDEFLFRIPEKKEDAKAFEEEMKNFLEPGDLEKIKENKKFKFLPECERYDPAKPEKTRKSNNLRNVKRNELEDIIKDDNENKPWIYKAKELKFKKLTENLGVTDDKKILQRYVGTDEIVAKEEDLTNKEKILPISQNNFNVLDMKTIKENSTKNFDNFQWAILIKFLNPLQMGTFVKTLEYLRQNSNLDLMKKQIVEENPITSKTALIKGNKKEKEEKKENSNEEPKDWIIRVSEINLRRDYEMSKDSKINILLDSKKDKTSIQRHKCLITDLHVDHPQYDNELLKDKDIKNEYDKMAYRSGSTGLTDFVNDNKDPENFLKKFILEKRKFNSGKKNINFGPQIKQEMSFNDLSEDMDLYVSLVDPYKKDKVLDEFYAKLNCAKVMQDKKTDFLIEPLIKSQDKDKLDDKLPPRIYGRIRVDFMKKETDKKITPEKEKDNDVGIPFEDAYFEDNKKEYESIKTLLEEQNNFIKDSKLGTKNLNYWEKQIKDAKGLNCILKYKHNPIILKRVVLNSLSQKFKKTV
ncbi:MAG: hypothetical protein MJ252_23500, partial [archaeon]|nr:hypothetical protein [archaeon]